MRHVFSTLRASCAILVAAALVLGALPVRAEHVTGLGHFEGPITTWLARAPASCVMSSYISGEPPLPDSKRVAYWIGHAMDGDEAAVDKLLWGPSKNWNGMTTGGGTERVEAVYDPLDDAAAFSIGHQDMNDWGALAGETGRRRVLLATVRSALGLHALIPTDVAPACPGLGVVEVCDWNIAGCAPTPRPGYEGKHLRRHHRSQRTRCRVLVARDVGSGLIGGMQ